MARKPAFPDFEDADVYALQALAADPKHRRALNWIMNRACGLYDETFVAGQPDLTANNNGTRTAGWRINYMLHLDMDKVKKLRSVARKRKPTQ